MIINMTTIAVRQKHYIDRTLDSLFASDGRDLEVNLILGSADASHVEKYRGRVNIVAWDERSQSLSRPDQMRRNCTLNAIRALRHGDAEHCLCCEDDIRFVPDWLSQLRATIEQIPDEEYVLNLGQATREPSEKRYATHEMRTLIGAQGIFYPSKVLRDQVALFLERNLTQGFNDDLVGRFAKKYAQLYNTVPKLVAHIGQTSSFTQRSDPT